VSKSYFQRVKAQTPTRLWVNSPTVEEIGKALAQGAVGCTTNPAYGGGLLKRAPDDVMPFTRDCLLASDDDRAVADLVQQRLVGRIVERFLPLHEASGGAEGFVSIQGAPDADTDGEHILEEAHVGHAIGPNATPKIPATLPGFYAFERVVAEGYPTIITEVFSLAQLVYASETYLAVTEKTGTRPPFFMSPITGIFGDHLKKIARRDGIDCEPAVIDWAGVALARACNAIVEERGYPVTLLFGGARVMHDFTALVGAKTAATINYSTVDEILTADPAVEDTIHQATDPAIVAELTDKFDDFRRAMFLDGLSPDEYEGFGPVQHFRDNFIAGWNGVLAAIAVERAAAG
jgi:transaldolase